MGNTRKPGNKNIIKANLKTSDRISLVYNNEEVEMSLDDFLTHAKGYKEYVALLTQTSTNAPVATIIRNELSGTPVWSYANVGVYDMTLTGEFLSGTTGVFIMTAGPSTVSGGRNNDDKIRLRVLDDTGTGQDAKLTDSLIRVIVTI